MTSKATRGILDVGWTNIGTGNCAGRSVTHWQHFTGARHLHWHADPAEQTFGITFRTPACDDRGAPHVLEHWMGAGSRRYPVSSALLTARYRCWAHFTNGLTETGRTSFTFAVTNAADYLNMLDVVLDLVYWPLLEERQFLREGCRAEVPPNGWTGIVYNEMLLKKEPRSAWVARLAARALDPLDPAQYSHAGVPAAIPMLDRADTVAFHARYYQPVHAFSFACSPDCDTTLALLGEFHRERAERSLPRAAWGETAARPGEVPLCGGPASGAKQWLATRIRLTGSLRGSMAHAFKVYDLLRDGWARESPERGVNRPIVHRTGADVLAYRPANSQDGPSPVIDDSVRRGLRELAADTSTAAAETVLHRLGESYKGMPPSIRLGLTLAPARLAGADPLSLVAPTGPAELRRIDLVTCLVGPGGHKASAGIPGSARASADQAVWNRPGPSQDASVLPMLRLSERALPPTSLLQSAGPRLEFLPAEEKASYLHALLEVTAETAALLAPLTVLLGASEAVGGWDDATGAATVRDADGRPVIDVLIAGQSPHCWAGLLSETIGHPADVPHFVTAVQACLAQQSSRLLTSPDRFAVSAAAAQISPVAAAQDRVTGLPAMVTWRTMIADQQARVGKQLTQLVDLAAEPQLRLLEAGPMILEDAVREAGRLPSAPVISRPQVQPVAVRSSSDRSGRYAHAVAWLTPATEDPGIAAVLAADLERRIAHPLLREDGGAYGAFAEFDRHRKCIAIGTNADPEGRSRLDQLSVIVASHYQPPGRDDLETARLAAAMQFSAATELDERLRRALPSGGQGPPSLERIATVTPADVYSLARRFLKPELCATATVG